MSVLTVNRELLLVQAKAKSYCFVRICKRTIPKWLTDWFNESAVLKYKKDALSLLNKRFIKIGHIREIEPNL
jgi:hypothetical protein